ncbi:hypothetical protein NYZ99_15300 [Maribacter litopenaei]|uniref:Uncharacterized protein n=1 Tax=Maribacter litopenaei TaxID=2976127 RepID=A0ABY5Y5Z8_9FLAO|nr:hypothetical protein [Maribacter litopenaei]UWX54304.1 hypothetical protein NYZ99_15300 [Maribacter litopenaei]
MYFRGHTSDPVFKDRIFNALYELKRGGTIANMAFPKLDEFGTIQNYVLYNRPYTAKPNKPPQKFQVVLNSKTITSFIPKFQRKKQYISFLGKVPSTCCPIMNYMVPTELVHQFWRTGISKKDTLFYKIIGRATTPKIHATGFDHES